MSAAHRARLLAAAAGVAGACVLAGCGSSTPPPVSTPSPVAAPTLPPGSDTYPAVDTPIGQASAAMAATWRQYGVTLIPGHSTVDPSAQWPRTIDASGGALTAAEAAAVGAAVMRTQVVATWADENRQIALEPHLMNAPFLLGTSGVALAEGTSVHTPPCGEYPTDIEVHAPSASARDALVKAGQNIGSTAIPVEMGFAGPCTVTGTTRDGRTVTVDTLPAGRIVAMVELRDDPVLGSIARLDAATSCGDPAVAGICSGA